MLALFGDDRCCFASNFPVDIKVPSPRIESHNDAPLASPSLSASSRCGYRVHGACVGPQDGWPAPRLYAAFVGLTAKLGLSDEQQRKLFCTNAKRWYRAE